MHDFKQKQKKILSDFTKWTMRNFYPHCGWGQLSSISLVHRRMAHKNRCKGEIPTRLHKKQMLENELAFLGRTERQLVQINQNLPLVRGGCFKSFTIDRAG